MDTENENITPEFKEKCQFVTDKINELFVYDIHPNVWLTVFTNHIAFLVSINLDSEECKRIVFDKLNQSIDIYRSKYAIR